MRLLTLFAVLALLAAAPAVAGDRGGGHPGGHCCAPPPPPPPSCCHPGGSRNVNINVNASVRASAEASAFAGSWFNAHAYDVGGMRGRGSGGTVYVGGGGYGGDMAWGYAGAPVYYDIDRRVLACASAPFGYVVTGFGREGRQPPSCGAYVREDYGYDRGGRYGYSERHDSYEARSYESYESYEEYGAYEESAAYSGHGRHDHDRRDCDCRERAPYPPPYLPEPPRYEPPAPPPARPHPPRRRRHEAPPRQQYRQEPGERG